MLREPQAQVLAHDARASWQLRLQHMQISNLLGL